LEAQAHLLAFMDAFHVIGIVTLVAAPLVLFTQYFRVGGSKSPPAGH
jgi:DHA2 family multidrug resistance protein